MGGCGDEKHTKGAFETALEAVLSCREAMTRSASAPVRRWTGGKGDDGTLIFSYPEYHAEVEAFFTALAEFLHLWEPLSSDYLATSRELRDDPDAVATAGPEEVKAYLTFLWRGERFCDGFWGAQLQSGIITPLLDRLDELHRMGDVKRANGPS